MSRKARSLQHLDARLRELAAAKAALEQELDQALGRAVRRTREHTPPDVWATVLAALAPYGRSEADRRALGLATSAGGLDLSDASALPAFGALAPPRGTARPASPASVVHAAAPAGAIPPGTLAPAQLTLA